MQSKFSSKLNLHDLMNTECGLHIQFGNLENSQMLYSVQHLPMQSLIQNGIQNAISNGGSSLENEKFVSGEGGELLEVRVFL